MANTPHTAFTPLPSVIKVRPMLMFTGFLGAGKTTMLRELLGHLADQKIYSDVILNDRENAHIDKATLNDQSADIEALTGSCVCCEGFNDLIEVIMKASSSPNDVLLIELNGTADPIPLQESFTILESKFCLRPRWQVCVIDARYFRKRRKFNDLESLQLESASHFYISWSDDLTDGEEQQLLKDIKSINSVATRTTAKELAEALRSAISKNTGHTLAAKDSNSSSNSSLNLGLKSLTSEEHAERHKLAHEFTGCQIIIPHPVEQSKLTSWLDLLPDSIIRAKALVRLNSDTERLYLYERVGTTTSPEPISAQRKSTSPCSGIFIGADLDPLEILKLTKEHLHPDCHFSEPESSEEDA